MTKTIHTERHAKFRTLLVERRKARGVSQDELAARLDKPQSYVSKYEIGERRLDVMEFLDIAQALGFDPCEALREL